MELEPKAHKKYTGECTIQNGKIKGKEKKQTSEKDRKQRSKEEKRLSDQ